MKSESNVSIPCSLHIYTPGIRTNYLSITLLRLDSSPYAINNERRPSSSSSTYVLSLSDVHIFLLRFFFLHQDYTHTHIRSSFNKKKTSREREGEREKRKRFYILMITMMIYMFYTLLPLEKFNNEMHSSMSTIGEIEARVKSECEKAERRRERERERRDERICKRT